VAVWYLDSENEITDAVARLRGATDEHVVFVVPPGSRIATGRINFRLLSREAEARGKRLAIASPDGQVRAMATSAGVLARSSAAEAEAALDRGDSVSGEAEPGESAGNGSTAGIVDASATMARGTFVARNARRTTVAVVGVMTIAVVAIVASLQTLPTARIVLTPRTAALGPLAITVTARAGLTAPDVDTRQVPAVRLPIPLIVEDTFPANGTRTSQAQARGRVVFRGPASLEGEAIEALTRVFVGDIEFRTTQTAYLRPSSDGRSVEVAVPVEAVRAGPEANVAAGAIDEAPSLAARGIEVTNPEAMAGGLFEETLLVTKEDYDAAVVNLRQRLEGALASYQQDPTGVPAGLTVFPQTVAPGEVTFDPPAAELVGAEADAFRLRATMAAHVLGVDQDEVAEMMTQALADEIPQDMAVVPASVVIETSTGVPEGDAIRFDGEARAVAQQVIDADALVARVAGLPVSEARAILEDLGASTVSVWPEFLGDLPGDRSRIQLDIRTPSTTE
jgi:hypothetical protein